MPAMNEGLEKVLLEASVLKDFRDQLLRDPASALRSRGIDVPEGVKVRIVEDDFNSVTIPLPPFVGRNITGKTLDDVYAGGSWTACTLCVMTTPICTLGTVTSIIVATQD